MAIDVMLYKANDGTLHPATDVDKDIINNLKSDQEYGCSLTQLRNGKHHRLMFSLLKFAYDNSERITIEYEGQVIGQSFDSFRESLVISAGYYTMDVVDDDLSDEELPIRYRAQSLSYSQCSQDLAERIYNDLLTVICDKVFSGNYAEEELDNISKKLMNYL